jgi:transcriptional regulator with XRE-family HTH domain
MPSIGKDLAKIRISLGLSLQDIQATIKIPISTLEKIENGSIFEDSEHGKTYVRSFIRSYGRALKIDSEVMINGLDQQETGNYNHLLWNYFEAGQESPSFKNFTFDDLDPSSEDLNEDTQSKIDPSTTGDLTSEKAPVDETKQKKQEQKEINSEAEAESKAGAEAKTEDLPKTPKKTAAPPISSENVDWANMGHKFTESKKTTPIWIFIILIATVVVFAVGYFIYANDLLNFTEASTEDTETTAIASNNGNNLLDLEEPVDINETASPVGEGLDEILYITVYAAYERLEPVRVWSDIKPRMDPYWVERGTAMNFDFRDTVRIRGQYPNMLIFKNGHAIDDALELSFNQQDNYIELTREYFSSDPKWVTSRSFQLPEGVAEPDTVLLRPTF